MMVLVLVRDTYTLKHDLYGSHIIAYIMSDRFSEKLLVTQTDKELILLTYNFVAFLGLIGFISQSISVTVTLCLVSAILEVP